MYCSSSCNFKIKYCNKICWIYCLNPSL